MKPKIVIVEDDVFLAEMYATKFEFEGFEMHVANNGDEGIKLIQKVRPDVILLDILLPKKNGFEVLEELKANDELKDLPVILLTNLGQKEDVDKGIELGAVDYLIKAHFVPSEVVQKVKNVIKASKK